jgi:hypothetical protein
MTARRKKAPFGGGLIVVGGQCRKVGKTALVVDLIRAFPGARWTTVKITPYTDVGCPVHGPSCNCEPKRHTFAIREEQDLSGESDTSRFLAAGAERAIWVQTKEGRVADVLEPLAAKLSGAGNVIIESDAIVKFWKPHLYLMVLDPRRSDFKASARVGLRAADAFVWRSPAPRGKGKEKRTAAGANRATFLQPLGRPLPGKLRDFLVQRLRGDGHLMWDGRGLLGKRGDF